jgi:hypothetical protein
MNLHLVDVLQLGQEPLVDVGHLPDLVYRVAAVKSCRYCEDAFVSRVEKLFVNILD